MTVDISKIKPGDEITIRCRAYERYGEGWKVRSLSDPMGNVVLDEHIVSHTPKALTVGDQVKAAGWRATLTVLAIDGPWAWLKDAEGSRMQQPLAALERAP